MNDPNAKYSIALPNLPQYRNLWERLPQLAKERIGITAIFIDADSNVTEDFRNSNFLSKKGVLWQR